MRIIRPHFLVHGGEKKDFEVYSCHVSPDGKRLVTSAGDGHVRIWSTDAVYNARDENYRESTQLCSISHHSGTIHTVRFSPNNKYLASGADDKIVCIYVLDSKPPIHTGFGDSSEPPPVENWRVFRRLIGHDNDVQDLGWSYDSSVIVSVGLDSKVVVWSGHTFEKLKTITSHQSHVKGITFDPANKYFATASDDRSIKIFRFTPPGPNATAHDQASNFALEKTITAPFQGSPLTTYFRRCSWSPDGAHLAGANAVNGPVSTVAIINRGTWDGDIHLVGHEAPVEVTAFCPRLWSSTPIGDSSSSSNSPHVMTVIACASQDKSISVWLTTSSRPIIIAQGLANKSISDLAWSPDGQRLFATSLDGSIQCLEFEDHELGYCAPLEENEKALAKYGGQRKNIGLPESASALLLEEKAKEFEMNGVDARMGALMGEETAQASTASAASLSFSKDVTRSSTPLPNGTTNGDTTKAKDKDSADPATTGKDAEAAEKSAQDAKIERVKSRVTITKDGKKRMAPLLVSSSAGVESSLPRAQLRNAVSVNASADNPQSVLDLSKPYDGLPKGGLAALLLGNKRKYVVVEGEEENGVEKRVEAARKDGAVPILQNGSEGLTIARSDITPSATTVPDFIRPAVVNPSLSVSSLRLAVPKLRASIVRRLDANGAHDIAKESGSKGKESLSDVQLEVKNPTGPSPTGRFEDREPARLLVTKKGQPIWQDFVPKNVLLVAGGSQFWVAACEDGSIYSWTSAGRRLTNAIILEAQPVILESMDSWLLCVTAVGLCYVWNMETVSSPHPPVSLAPILDIAAQTLGSHTTKAPSVTSVRVNSEGKIVVSLTNGDGYSYNPSAYSWQRLSEVWWAVGSQYWNTTDGSVGNISTETQGAVSDGIVPFLERNTTNEMLVRGRAYFTQRLIKALVNREGYESLESTISIGHLENRMAAAMLLGSKADFKTYLYMYARRLGPEGLKIKAEELLRGLLGPLDNIKDNINRADSGKAEKGWSSDRNWRNPASTLCGWPRKDLLRDVVLILGKYREFQRLTAPYAKLVAMSTNGLTTNGEETDLANGNEMIVN